MDRRLGSARVVVGVAILVVATSAQAATLDIAGGELLGASGVDVNGTLYRVDFVDGTCVDLFGGCDSVGDLAFDNSLDAESAAQALIDQVFLDLPGGLALDSDPSLTKGCESLVDCLAAVPYEVLGPPGGPATFFNSFYARNASGISFDQVFPAATTPVNFDTFSSETVVFAIFTPVPEPGTGFMIGIGLLILATSRRSESST